MHYNWIQSNCLPVLQHETLATKKWVNTVLYGDILNGLADDTELGAQCLSGRVLDSRPKGRGFKPQWRH